MVQRRTFLAIAAASAGAAALNVLPSSAADPIRIGVLTGTSGAGAQVGTWHVQGVQLAIDELNVAAGTERFKAYVEDSQFNAQKGVEGFNKLTTLDQVSILIAAGSVVISPVAPLADQRQVVLMNVGAQTPAMAGIGKFTFSVLELADFDIQVISKYAFTDLGLKRGAILFLSNDVGKFNSVEFEKQFTGLGGEIVANESFRATDTSLGAQVAKIASATPDFVYVVAEVDSTAAAVRQVRGLMPNTQIMSYGGSVENDIFLKGAGPSADGLLYTATDFDPDRDDPLTQKFTADYTAKFGGKPASAFIGYAYDAMMIIAAGLDKSQAVGEPLRDAIMTQRNFPGVTGAVVFRDDGTVSKSVLIKKVADGKFETVTKVEF